MTAAAEPDLWSLDAAALAEGYRAGTFSPVEALASVHERIDRMNARLNAVIAEDREAARRAAEASEQRWRAGAPVSALDGVPLTVKDNIFVAGLPATWGCRAYESFAPPADELAVARLRAGGVIILGKTNVPEFTLQGFTSNLVFGTTINPHAPGRTPGGSTGGGAAAVAAGFGPLAIGTDGGGSLRRPAAHCGLYALKPSIGEIPRCGGFRQILADFEVIGLIGRTLADLSAAFSLMRGSDPRDPRSLIAERPSAPFAPAPRIGCFNAIGEAPVDRRIVAAAERFAGALAEAGCLVERIEAPFDAALVGETWGTIAAVGLAWEVEKLGARATDIDDTARAMAERGAAVSTASYLDALAAAADIRARAAEMLNRFDLLVRPSIAALAWPAEDPFPPTIDGRPAGPRGHAVFTAWMNIAGLPAVNLPIGLTEEEGGIGVQVVAAQSRDRGLLDFLLNLEPVAALGPAPLPKDFARHA
jgi:aspartyl-tRNA(Asn)/glutamyl-tRNA(Gln) amidotransferase subunit A